MVSQLAIGLYCEKMSGNTVEDFFSAGYELAAHILDCGRQRLAFVARPAFPATTDLRLAGGRAAVTRTEHASVEFCVGDPDDKNWLRTVWRQTRCEAIICANDSTAAHLMRSLGALQCRVPKDVMVAGFTDAHCATRLSPPLTTMRQPYAALAGAAVEAMITRLRMPRAPARRILLHAKLIVRESTGR